MAHCLNREKKQNFWWATMYVEAHIFGDCILNRIPFADVWCTWYKGCTHVYKHTQNSKLHFEVTFSFGSLSWFLKTFSNGRGSCGILEEFLGCSLVFPWWAASTKVMFLGFPAGSVANNPGANNACQCRRHRFDPWSGKILHAVEKLSPCAATIEPML